MILIAMMREVKIAIPQTGEGMREEIMGVQRNPNVVYHGVCRAAGSQVLLPVGHQGYFYSASEKDWENKPNPWTYIMMSSESINSRQSRAKMGNGRMCVDIL